MKKIVTFAYLFLLSSTCHIVVAQTKLQLGSTCILRTNKPGICRKLSVCESAISELHDNGEWPVSCLDSPDDPIVCCDEHLETLAVPTPSTIDTTIKLSTTVRTTTTTVQPPNNEKEGIFNRIDEGPQLIAGDRSRKQCDKYSRWLRSPVGLGFGDDEWIPGICGAKGTTFIYGGSEADKMEFPHMAQIGVKGKDFISHCGGSLISEKFVITAAHCLNQSSTHVRLGHGERRHQIDVQVEKIHIHPKYISSQGYHDIALLQLKTPRDIPLKFNNNMRPACLQAKNMDFKDMSGIVTGWGRTETTLQNTERLMKAILPFVNYSECESVYGSIKSKIERGIDYKLMVCAGGRMLGIDTCQGDSGGPLQILLKEPSCMYSIVGLTSFGDICGKNAGVYTRVSAYIPWIESIVWPNNKN